MKFEYKISDSVDAYKMARNGAYYTEETIRNIKVREALETDSEEWWPIYNAFEGYSWEYTECDNINDAYVKLLEAKNQSIYEIINDL